MEILAYLNILRFFEFVFDIFKSILLNCDIVYGPELWPPDLPQTVSVMINLDDYHMPFLTKRLFPVTPISKFQKEKKNVTWISCHHILYKSQGLTFSKIAVDLGPKESLRATYSTFITVHRLEDALIKVPFAKDRLDQIRGALATD